MFMRTSVSNTWQAFTAVRRCAATERGMSRWPEISQRETPGVRNRCQTTHGIRTPWPGSRAEAARVGAGLFMRPLA